MTGLNDSEQFIERLRTLIREIRIDSGKTQTEFVNKVEGLQQSTIARIETGRSENIGIKLLYEISIACGVSLSELISRAELKKSQQEDHWTNVEKQVDLLSTQKRKWLAKIVKDILTEP